MKKKVVLLDAYALLHRSYHAMPNFTTHNGRPSGALFGFIKMILKIKDELKPDYVLACFDRKEKTFRKEVYENYKANRSKTEDSLISQINEAPKICEALNIPIYSIAGFEADDIIGTIVEKLKKNNFIFDNSKIEIFIASGDMDTMQLIDKENNVKVYTLKKSLGETIIYKYEDIEKKYGFKAEQIVDFKGLKGDSSDNIIGIKGIGEKTATVLINAFESIENMYKIIHEDINNFDKICREIKITERVKNLIIEGEEDAVFSKTLATIVKDVDLDFSLPKEKWLKNINIEKFLEICREFEFRSFYKVFNTNNNKEEELKIGGYEDLIDQNSNENKYENDTEIFLENKVLLNLIDSEITNAEKEIILEKANTKNLNEAKENFIKIIKEQDLLDLYNKVEYRIIGILSEMKKVGIFLNIKTLKKQEEILKERLNNLEKEIFKIAGEEFNIASPKQLGHILYEKLKIGEKIKKTAGGILSTNVKELEKLKEKNIIVQKVLEYRKLFKLLNTYVETLPNYVDQNNIIHSTFIQTGTTTGRFSSESPNLQNLPAKGEDGLVIRKAFESRTGFIFLSIDYSQIDLRSAAILSGDKNLINIFNEDIDVHTGVASKIFKIKESEINTQMRNYAKTINFGILYGMGVLALKDSMKVSRKEAQEFYDEYKKTFNIMMNYLENVKIKAKESGYTETLLKRRRYIYSLKSSIPFLRAQGERIAINAPVQGTTSDILKLAMIDVYDYIKENRLEEKVNIILQIHDELILEIKENLIDKIKYTIKDIFENVLTKRIKDINWKHMFLKDNFVEEVKLKAEIKTGKNLYELK